MEAVDEPQPPARKRESVAQARVLIKKWADRFGFGHYNARVRVLPKKLRPDFFALCAFDHEEESFDIDVVPDGTLPPRQLEFVVIHELTHGLVSYARQHDAAEETICNRVARAFTRSSGPNTDDARSSKRKGHRRTGAFMPLRDAIDALPDERERYVLSRIYFGQASLQEVGRELGGDKWLARRIRDRGLLHLREPSNA